MSGHTNHGGGAMHGFTLEALLDALAARLWEHMERRETGLISHLDKKRGLGPRRHREAVKRRIAERAGGAYVIGREYKLTPEALREELERFGPRGAERDNDGEPLPQEAPPRPPKARPHRGGGESAEVAAMRLKLDTELGQVTPRAPRSRKRH
jgi:hypothetical protein